MLKPVAFAPFAGKYTLGSRLSDLTDFRGVPSVTDATKLLSNEFSDLSSGILQEQFDVYDLNSRSLTKNKNKYELSRSEYLALISDKILDYDNDDWDDEELNDLIQAAYSRFKRKAEEIGFNSDTKVFIQSDKVAFQLSTKSSVEKVSIDALVDEPFVRIKVDHNLLHRLLRGPRFAH